MNKTLAALTLIFYIFCGNFAQARDLDKQYSKAQFKIGKVPLTAYIADSDSKRSEGLMFIEKLPENTGMLFVFEHEQPLGFWMKNTLIPLSIGFFDKNGKLFDIQEMKPASSLMSLDVPTYRSNGIALYALEMSRGWFEKHKIQKGAQLQIISKSDSPLLKGKLSARQKASLN